MTVSFRKKNIVRALTLFVVTVAIAAGCSMPTGAEIEPDSLNEPPGGSDSATDPQILTIEGPTFSLAWDSDATEAIAHRVYFREYGSSEWQVLVERVTTGRYEVGTDDLPYGTYEFAVSSLNAEGDESDLHHSFDRTAEPEPWMLEWKAL